LRIFNSNHLNWIVILFLFSVQMIFAAESDIRLIVAGRDRAVIEIDGERVVLSNSSPIQDGIQLISTDGNEVIIIVNNIKHILNTEQNAALVYDSKEVDSESTNSAILWANSNGFFFADGVINGQTVSFLVDTGADIVTFSSALADQLGIDYSQGQVGYASTASGITQLKTLNLESISIQDITLYDVAVSVVKGKFPDVPLLGGSFLNHLNMNRTGNRMELTLQ
jgi:aspartyl protease family protein